MPHKCLSLINHISTTPYGRNSRSAEYVYACEGLAQGKCGGRDSNQRPVGLNLALSNTIITQPSRTAKFLEGNVLSYL